VAVPKAGLGYAPPQPVQISGRRKDKQPLVQYIAIEETTGSDEEDVKNKPKSSVFNRLQSSTSQGRTSVFDRAGNNKMLRPSIFWRLKVGTQSKPSVFTRIKSSEELSSLSKDRALVFGRLGKTNEVQSVIPCHMKRLSTLAVSTDGSLRVKKCTMVFTSHKAHPSPSEEVIEKEQASSNHITVREDDSDSEIELAETPGTLEDGGQAMVDELKELNLGTPEDSHPIYVSSLLTSKEENEYFNLLGDYKDVFA